MNNKHIPPQITFKDEEPVYSAIFRRSVDSIITLGIIKYSRGYIANKRQVNRVLTGFIVVTIIVFLTLLLNSDTSRVTGPIPHGTSLTVPG